MTEYEFTMPDDTRRYEMCETARDAFAFRRMHGAVSCRPMTGELAELYERRMSEKAAAKQKRAA